MALDPGRDHKQLDEKTTLSSLHRNGYYIHRMGEPWGRYLSLAGTWECDCTNGWFHSVEHALKVFEKTKPKVPIFAPELVADQHWEPRDA